MSVSLYWPPLGLHCVKMTRHCRNQAAISRQCSHEHRAYKYHNFLFNHLFSPLSCEKAFVYAQRRLLGHEMFIYIFFFIFFPLCSELLFFVMLLGLLLNRRENCFCFEWSMTMLLPCQYTIIIPFNSPLPKKHRISSVFLLLNKKEKNV